MTACGLEWVRYYFLILRFKHTAHCTTALPIHPSAANPTVSKCGGFEKLFVFSNFQISNLKDLKAGKGANGAMNFFGQGRVVRADLRNRLQKKKIHNKINAINKSALLFGAGIYGHSATARFVLGQLHDPLAL